MSLSAGIPEVLRASRYKGEVEYFDEDDHVWRTMPPEKKLVPPHIKPIETKFRGYRFRSRLEARWAVYFDAMGMAWEYEKEGYDLGEAGWYLPDFWLPYYASWAEVKPGQPNHAEKKKAQALCNLTGKRLFWLIGPPDIDDHSIWQFNLPDQWFDESRKDLLIDHRKILMLYTHRDGAVAALSARFEHGESP